MIKRQMWGTIVYDGRWVSVWVGTENMPESIAAFTVDAPGQGGESFLFDGYIIRSMCMHKEHDVPLMREFESLHEHFNDMETDYQAFCYQHFNEKYVWYIRPDVREAWFRWSMGED